MKNKKPTMQEIAEALEITTITVSRALNNQTGVSPALAAEIKMYAEKIGYMGRRKSTEPQTIVQKKLMLLVADVFMKTHNTMYIDFYKKILDILQQKGIIGILNIISEEETAHCYIPEMLYGQEIDMLVLLGEFPSEYISILCSVDIPLLLIDFYDERLAADAVIHDNFFDSFLLTRFLIQKGHRNIAFVGNINSTHSIQDRFLGFSKALIRADIPVAFHNVISDRNHNGEFIELAIPDPLPSAFLCNCDEVARRLISQLKERGIEVPHDCSVAAFDNTYFSTNADPAITVMAADIETMAAKSAEVILRKLKHPDYKIGLIPVRGRLISRSSVRKII